jgi:molybdopterin converting factor small subunit
MRVNVRFYASLSQLIGAREIELDLPEAAKIADLSRRLVEAYPQHAALMERMVFLVDGKGTTEGTELADGARVMALMILSGG